MFNQLISIAMRSPTIRILLNTIRVRELAAAVLRVRPLRRRVPGSTLTYRVTILDNLIVAREIFAQHEYGALTRFRDIGSFADLGSNCGYFTLFIAGLADARTIKGIAVDAHPQMVEQTRWHIEHNELRQVHAVWGLLGGPEGSEGRFFVNIDAAGSSQFDRAPAQNVTKNPWLAIVAPTVSLENEWQRRFDSAPCDVLKIDIEGSEDALLHRETAFLQRVGILVIEMHRWIVDVDALEAYLASQQFERIEVLRSSDTIHVAMYVNRNGRFYHSSNLAPL
jgi:FkbM family methyltransferase